MQRKSKYNLNKAFTLVELLIAIAILGILSTIALGSFQTAQLRGRDAKRKSDLKQITNAIELFYQDYGMYPPSSGTQVAACPFTPPTGPGSICTWGSSEVTDGKTSYLKIIPKDPGSGSYIYKVSSTGRQYQLYAYLENTQDKNINLGITVSCGSGLTCNFSITSPNTTPTETLP